MNWREPFIYFVLYATGSKIPRYLKQIRKYEYLSQEEITELTNRKLEELLFHSYNNVPYYHKILEESDVVVGGQVRLENFSRIPILTKEIIRKEGENLYSKDYKQRRPYENTSGGSTGEPIRFIQDKLYEQWNIAHKIYLNSLQGSEIGQKEIKLWGSERDVFKEKEKISTRVKYWLFNITNLNSFCMSDNIMSEYVTRWNKIRPYLVWAYTSSILELAKYLERSGKSVHSPKVIICTAETLTEQVRSFVEDTLKCPVVNQYGSREVGPIASECPAKMGLHIFSLQNKVEILNRNLDACQPGQVGDIYVTVLNNYSMPLIRYRIGDTGAPTVERYKCPCKRCWPSIAKLTGRQSDHFKTRDGKIIHGEYFTHLFYFRSGIKQFQVVQQDYDNIQVIIVSDGQIKSEEMRDIGDKIKLVMGQNCDVNFAFVDDIQPTRSGKYLYTVSNVK